MSTRATSSSNSSTCSACSEARLRLTAISCVSTQSSSNTALEGHRTSPSSCSDRCCLHSSMRQVSNLGCCRLQQSLLRSVIVLAVCLLILDFTSHAAAKVCEVPHFTKLPPPIVYRSPYHVPKFHCEAFPTKSRIVFLQRRQKEDFPTTLSEKEAFGSATYEFTRSSYVPETTDFYCRAHTQFGHVISRPFRVLSASIADYSVNEPSRTISFYKGNIAQVLCTIPKSNPPALVKFLKDGVVVGHSDKYLVATLPGKEYVALLIKEFSSADVGDYSCKARNPVSLQEVKSKAKTRLTLKKASSAFAVRFHVAFPFKSHAQQNHRVTVREGDNITLYCLPEGAPIPSVKWFRQTGNTGGLPDSATKFLDFGALRINNVTPKEASTYTCSIQQSDRMMSQAFKLEVEERLNIFKPPQDQVVERLGTSSKLSCEADGGVGKIAIQWYFNAQPISDKHNDNYHIKGSNLEIRRVTTDLLGIYQCVARSTKEWTSATAAVIMKGDVLSRGGESFKRHRTVTYTEGITATLTCPFKAADATRYDVEWYKGTTLLTDGSSEHKRFMPNSLPPTTYMNILMAQISDSGLYRCLLRNKVTSAKGREEVVKLVIVKKPSSGNPVNRWNRKGEAKVKPNAGPIDKNPTEKPKQRKKKPDSRGSGRAHKMRSKAPSPIGLKRPIVRKIFDNLAAKISWKYTGTGEVESYTLSYKMLNKGVSYNLDTSAQTGWSTASLLVTKYRGTSYLVTGDPLKPGYSYRFRVIVILKTPTDEGALRVRSRWSETINFRNILESQPRLIKVKTLSKNEVEVGWSFIEDPYGVPLTEFIVNYREQLSDKGYDSYFSKKVSDTKIRSVTIPGLKAGTRYQFRVYGVANPSNPTERKVTLFSNEIVVQTLSTTLLPTGAKKAATNRLTFLIIGCVIGLFIVVVAVLISICMWRQRKEKRRMRASALQAALNGTSIDTYKDPKFLIPGTNSASSQLLLSNLGDGSVWSQQQHLGQGVPPLPNPRNNSSNGGVRLNPEAASLMLNYDDRFSPLPPPLPPTGTTPTTAYFGNGTLRQPLYTTRGTEDPLYSSRLHPAYAVTSPMASIYPYPAPLGGPPGRFSPYAVAVPPVTSGGDGAESVYSYFSQQEAGTHTDGPIPYPASRTVDRPRHHRRKRRRPTNPTTCSQSGLESGSETGPPHMKDMAVNTDMSSSDAIYESSIHASTTASPPPRMGALMMGGMTELPVSTPASYKSPPGAPDLPPPPPPPAHPLPLSTPLTSVASSSPASSTGPPSSHTLTRRGTPNLFLDPPRIRDYQEYGVAVSPETGSNGGPVVPAV